MATNLAVDLMLNGNVSNSFKSAFKGVNKQIQTLTKSINGLENSPVGKLGAKFLRERQAIVQYGKSLAEAKKKLDELKKEQLATGNNTQLMQRRIQLAEAAVNKFQGSLQLAQNRLRTNAAEATNLSGSLSNLRGQYDYVTRAIDRMARHRQRLADIESLRSQRNSLAGDLMSSAATATTIAVPVMLSIDYEQANAQLKALTKANDSQIAQLMQQSRLEGKRTSFTATEAVQAQIQLAKAGQDTNQILAMIPNVLDLSTASGMDLGQTADILTDIMAQFGIKANETQRVVDVLTHGFTSCSGTLETFKDSFKYAGPIAKSSGHSIEQLTAYLEVLHNNGIKATQAGTALRSGLLRLAAPPKMGAKALESLATQMGTTTDEALAATKEAKEAVQSLGISIADEKGNIRNSLDILEDLSRAMRGMGSEEKLGKIKKIFGTESATAWLSLLDNGLATIDKEGNRITDKLGRQTNLLRKLWEDNLNVQGEARNYANQIANTTQGSLKKLTSAWQDVGISIGNIFLPVIRTAADFLSSVANVISDFTSKFPILSSGLAYAAGGFLAVGVAATTVKLAYTTLRLLGLSLATTFTNIGNAAIFMGRTIWTSLSKVATFAFGPMISGFKSVGTAIVGIGASGITMGSLFTVGAGIFRAACGLMKTALISTGIGALIWGIGEAAAYVIENWTYVSTFFSEITGSIGTAFSGLWNGIVNGAIIGSEWVKNTWFECSNWIQEKWTAVGNWFSELWTSISTNSDGSASAIKICWDGVKNFFGSIINTIKGWFSSFFDWLASKFALVASIINWIKGVYNSISGAVSNAHEKAVAANNEAKKKNATIDIGPSPEISNKAFKPIEVPAYKPGPSMPLSSGSSSAKKGKSGGGGRKGKSGGSGSSKEGRQSKSTGQTIVRLGNDNKFHTYYIPAGSKAPSHIKTMTGANKGNLTSTLSKPASKATKASSTSSAISRETKPAYDYTVNCVAAKPLPVIVTNFTAFGSGASSTPKRASCSKKARVTKFPKATNTKAPSLGEVFETFKPLAKKDERVLDEKRAKELDIYPKITPLTGNAIQDRPKMQFWGKANMEPIKLGTPVSIPEAKNLNEPLNGSTQVEVRQNFTVNGGNAERIQTALSKVKPDIKRMVEQAIRESEAQNKRVAYAQ